jgi:Zn-dependent protease
VEQLDFLQQIFVYSVEEMPFVFLALVIAFSVHEWAHAYSAYIFGDPTAKNEGRVTLNPRKHLDVIGTILIFIVGFGWAKPVPVNRNNFRSPRLMGIIVSAAGPLSNLFITFIGVILTYLLFTIGAYDSSSGSMAAIRMFLNKLVELNAILFVFNFLPLPPLDGYRIMEDLAPQRIRLRMQQNVQWGVFFFLLIVFIPPLRENTLAPLFNFARYDLLVWLVNIVQFIAG